jgi:hypothetical protein
MFLDPIYKAKANKISKFHMQYQVRRDMFLALDEMHKMRASGELEKLIKIAENELGYHYQIKSEKLMCRKKEFIVEICNLIGLAHLDRLKRPLGWEEMSGQEQLAGTFDVSIAGKAPAVPYVFGDQSTYRDPGKPDMSFLWFKKNLTRIEGRLKQAQHPLENCHLFHEMARINLKQNNYEESRSFARKMIDEAENAGSLLWKFLARISICRAYLMQKNFMETCENLKEAKTSVSSLGISELTDVIDWCVRVCRNMFFHNSSRFHIKFSTFLRRSLKDC